MEIILRATAVFLFLLLMVRAMGKKELSELSAFELILLVTIGDLVQQGVTQEDMSLTGAFLAAGTLGLLVVAVSSLQFRWISARPALQGLPVVVIQDGRLLEEVARAERLTRGGPGGRSPAGNREPQSHPLRDPGSERALLVHSTAGVGTTEPRATPGMTSSGLVPPERGYGGRKGEGLGQESVRSHRSRFGPAAARRRFLLSPSACDGTRPPSHRGEFGTADHSIARRRGQRDSGFPVI